MSLGKDEDLFSDLAATKSRDGDICSQPLGENEKGVDTRPRTGTNERGFLGDHEETVISKAVEKAMQRIVKDSLAPMIQRIMLKIDSLDSKVKQMQLASEDVCQEIGEVKRQTDGLKEAVELIKEEMVQRFDALHPLNIEEEQKEEIASSVRVGELEEMFEKKASVVPAERPPPVTTQVMMSPPSSLQSNMPPILPPVPPHHAAAAPPLPPHHHHAQPPPPPLPAAPPIPSHHHHVQPPPPPPPPQVNQSMYYSGSNQYQNYATEQPAVSSSGYEGMVAGPAPSQGTSSRPNPSASKPASVPIEKVIDDISIMGFSREEVRNVLRELTAQGKPVDMNIVLDRLGAR